MPPRNRSDQGADVVIGVGLRRMALFACSVWPRAGPSERGNGVDQWFRLDSGPGVLMSRGSPVPAAVVGGCRGGARRGGWKRWVSGGRAWGDGRPRGVSGFPAIHSRAGTASVRGRWGSHGDTPSFLTDVRREAANTRQGKRVLYSARNAGARSSFSACPVSWISQCRPTHPPTRSCGAGTCRPLGVVFRAGRTYMRPGNAEVPRRSALRQGLGCLSQGLSDRTTRAAAPPPAGSYWCSFRAWFPALTGPFGGRER